MKIKVTQEHIDKGERHSPIFCPIALATRDSEDVKNEIEPQGKIFKRIFVSVGTQNIFFNKKIIYKLPTEAQAFVYCFDLGQKVKPFEFEI